MGERPIDHAVGGIEDPQPRLRADCDGDHPGDHQEAAQEPAAAELAVEEERAGHADQHLEEFGKERVLERVLQREREVGVLQDPRSLGDDLGVRLDEQVVLQLFLHLGAVGELAQRDGVLAGVRDDFPLLAASAHGPIEVLQHRAGVERGVAVAVHLDERHVIAGEVHDRLEALAGRLGGNDALLALVGEGARFLLALEGGDAEVVRDDLVRVDFRVVVPPDEIPSRAARLGVQEAQAHRHHERVRDEDAQVEHGGEDQQVPEGRLALEQRNAAGLLCGDRLFRPRPRRS